jgi:hypothetical protein
VGTSAGLSIQPNWLFGAQHQNDKYHNDIRRIVMRKSDFTITYLISSESSERLRLAEQSAKGQVLLDNVFIDIGRAFPDGVEATKTQRHRLGDYFDSIEITNGPEKSRSFNLVFHLRPSADRYWKDLAAEILNSIRKSAAGVSIKSVTKSS